MATKTSKPLSKALQYGWHDAAGREAHLPGHCRIIVAGIGGAGNNTVTRLMEMGITGTETVAINTDALHLTVSKANNKLLIGEKLTRGLGVGGDPKLGKMAIEESRKEVEELLTDADVVFVTAGLGGGTGTGAAPIVAEIARRSKKNAVTVGVVTTPSASKKAA